MNLPNAAGTGAPHVRLAQASIGATRLGIPADAVVQAIRLPDAPALLPRRQGALRCVVEHRGRPVPVVDLARWVDVGAGKAGLYEARILVLRDGGRSIGLQVDAIQGMVDVPAGGLTRLHHDDNPEDVFHTVAHPPGADAMLNVLDVGRLADLACAWSETEDTDAAPPAAAAAAVPAHASRSYALLQLAHARIAVPAEDVAAVVPMPALSAVGGGGIGVGTYCGWRGRHLPVLADDALGSHLCGGGGVDGGGGGDAHPLLAVIERDGLALGLPVRAALHLRSFDDPGLPAPGGLTATVFDADGLDIHLLDTARLFARFPEAALSRADAPPPAAGARAKRPVNACAYIVFEADGLGATPIEAVEHILPLASASSTLQWQGKALPLVDLRPAGAANTGGHVLVSSGAGRRAGYIVARVHTLIPPGAGTLYRIGAANGAGLEFITTGEGSEQRSYRTIDLASAPPAPTSASTLGSTSGSTSGSEHKPA